MPENSGWMDFLEDPSNQRAGYFAFQNRARSPNQTRFFQGQFKDVQDMFGGIQTNQIKQTRAAPTAVWTDYLRDYFDPNVQSGFQQQWGRMSPGRRGEDFARFAPPTRWSFR
jgi:hypothetical protein